MGKKQVCPKLILVLIDLLIVNVSYLTTMVFRLGHEIPAANFNAYLNIAPWICIFSIFVFFLFDLYHGWLSQELIRVFNKIIASVFLSTILIMSAIYLSHNLAMPRTVTIINPVIEIILFAAWRLLIWRIYRDRLKKKLAIIGRDEIDAEEIARYFSGPIQSKYSLEAVLFGEKTDWKEVLKNCDSFVLTSRAALDRDIVKLCINERKEILIAPDMFDILMNRADTEAINDTLLFSLKPPEIPHTQRVIKRIFDLLFSFLCLILLSPILLITALLIRISSPGPAFYCQERLGRGAKPFRLIKFRSMVHNAEEATGPTLAAVDDPRITKIGAFLRASRLDELPQLINVLKGEMSLVGPRPEREYFVRQFLETIPYYDYRMTVKPGITGLAQIMGKYNTSAEDKLRFDIMYIRDYSFLLDLKIIIRTMKVVFEREKAIGVSPSYQDNSHNA